MSQHDFDIDNQTASNTRVDINNALKALGSLSSGATEPTTTYANMLWYNTGNNWLYMRNEADSAWLRILYIDQANGSSIQNNTKIVGTGGAQTGLLGNQTTATWQSGTGTTQSLVSPANVKSAIEALVPPSTPTTAQVLSATAGASAGAVGTYIQGSVDASLGLGATVAGSSVRSMGIYKDGNYSPSGGYLQTGTWRCMGNNVASGDNQMTLYLRIS